MAAAVALAACSRGGGPLSDVSVQPAVISPNADGRDDIARIAYKVNQPADVSIYLSGPDGERYDLRAEAQRAPSPAPYELLFNGVSNGRLMPDGTYTWHVEAAADPGVQSYSGTLQITGADVPFPGIQELTLSSPVFSEPRRHR